MKLITAVLTDTSPAAQNTGIAGAQTIGIPGLITGVSVFAELVGATGGTLDVYIQTLVNNNVGAAGTWYDWLHFPQLAGGATAIILASHQTKETTNAAVLPTIGKNLVPALNGNQTIGGAWGEAFRLLYVAGAGTSAGAFVKVTLVMQAGIG